MNRVKLPRLMVIAAVLIVPMTLTVLSLAQPINALQPASRVQAVPGDAPRTSTVSRLSFALQPVPSGEMGTGMLQSTTNCVQPIYNSGLDHGYGWTTYFPAVELEEDPSEILSSPSALRMKEDVDGYKPPFTGDSDGFGQSFDYPTWPQSSVVIEYQFKYLDIGPADEVRYALFEVDPGTGTLLGNPIYEGTVPTDISYHDQQWHFQQVVVNYAPSIHDKLKGRIVALVFYTSTNDLASFLDVMIDDVHLKVCDGDAAPTGQISGSVSQDGNPGTPSGASVTLIYRDSINGEKTIGETIGDASGYYEFRNVPSLPASAEYQVQYVNINTATDRLSMWVGPIIVSFPDGHVEPSIDFDVTNVDLISPTHEAEATFPATFTWNGRDFPGEKFDLCIYDPHTLEEICPKKDLAVTTATIVQADLDTGFNFELDQRYAWFVKVKDSNGSDIANFGESYQANAITFVIDPSVPPNGSPPPSGTPPGGSGIADWTIMIYFAGDNNLGDPYRYFDPSLNLQGQFASLKQLIENPVYQKVNLVTLTDFYDDTGTEYCYLKYDGTQNCQQMGEQDTSDPMVLSSFISDTLQAFTATYTMLVISDHGHSIAGVAADETTSRTAIMAPDEIRQAFEAADLNNGKLDVLFYNACLMGSFEAAFDASFFADYLVASADELWVLNIYERLLPLLVTGGVKDDPGQVALGIVDAYKDSVEEIAPGYFISSAAFDLSNVADVNDALSGLAAALADELPFIGSEIESARAQVQVYDSSGNFELGSEDAFVDLEHLTTQLITSTSTTIAAAASDLHDALYGSVSGSPFIIDSQQTTGENGWGVDHDLADASGLSVYFPNGSRSGEQPTLTNLYLNRGIYQDYLDQTQWDEFLRLYISGALNSGPGRLESATRPVSGALPYHGEVFLPLILRQD
jgi:hypothetical protein